jgi:hypothetical protein
MNWFHRHGPWEVVSAHCDGNRHFPATSSNYVLLTEIVMRCQKCGKLKHRTLRGQHTLEQLRGEETEITRVLESLK